MPFSGTAWPLFYYISIICGSGKTGKKNSAAELTKAKFLNSNYRLIFKSLFPLLY